MMECSFVVGNISEIYLEETAEKASNVTGYLKETQLQTKNESHAFVKKKINPNSLRYFEIHYSIKEKTRKTRRPSVTSKS